MGFASLYPSYFFVVFCQKMARMSGAISGAVPDGRDAPAYRSAHAATNCVPARCGWRDPNAHPRTFVW